ncbi:putative SAM-dependent methyltransferase [Xylariales sp. AK1849]|nr:putative SAM-dependent methyltransferase [Xylariales sp. AK1849]
MTTQSHTIAHSEAPTIPSYSLQAPHYPDIEIAQAEHRIGLVNLWRISPGSRVLELGCGQGNATAVLAHALGPRGHVDAVDPGALDYGAPFTLAQAQDHISASVVGGRVAWHQATPEAFLSSTNEQWDVAVLAHCVWYFASPRVLRSIMGALKGRVGRVCIAEYALYATETAAVPHVLATIARGQLEAYKVDSTQNIRSPLSPRAIREIAKETGWIVREESTMVPEVGLLDGGWEVGTVKSSGFGKEIEQTPLDEGVRVVIEAARDALIAAIDGLKDGERVRTMDVWVATFEE